MRVIGLMSGTSADGVDAALVEWPDDAAAQPFELLAARDDPHEPELQARIHALAAGELAGDRVLGELAALDSLLADRFADAALAVARDAGIEMRDIAAIASHGQTVAHHPEHRASLQLGNAARIAELAGRPVVSDFRSGDLAAGGEGAPLAPFFHFAAFSQRGEARVALNLGGIANLTWLPGDCDPDSVIAFDTGPANSLIDGVLYAATNGEERFDRAGARAQRGSVDARLLGELLDDEYLTASPPKSTGRERYGRAEAQALWASWGTRPLDDLVATLAALTVASIARACRDHLPRAAERLVVGGGGARNLALMNGLADELGCPVDPFDALGVPADAAEAMAFSLLGRNTLLGIANHLPRTTGARHAAVLGSRTPGSR